MSEQHQPLVVSTTIEAPASVVFDLVSDVTRTHEWSPQVLSSRWKEPAQGPAVGARFTNKNQHGDMEWVTRAEVVEFAPGERFAYRVEENWTVWSFDVAEQADGSTVLTQRRETPQGVSELSQTFIDSAMGGWDAFTETMRRGMEATVAGVKATAQEHRS